MDRQRFADGVELLLESGIFFSQFSLKRSAGKPEFVRDYFSLRAKAGALKGVTNIGTFYYDDSKTKTNGEFDVVLQRRNKYDIYEVKYYNSPMGIGDMRKEEAQIRELKGLQVGNIGFVSVMGFEELSDDYDLISGEDLYREI